MKRIGINSRKVLYGLHLRFGESLDFPVKADYQRNYMDFVMNGLVAYFHTTCIRLRTEEIFSKSTGIKTNGLVTAGIICPDNH